MKRKELIDQMRDLSADFYAMNHKRTGSRKYVLAGRADWAENVLDPTVKDLISEQQKSRKHMGKPFPLHKDIHHGLSSQACCFNLLGPLVANGKNGLLKSVLALAAPPIRLTGNICDSQFEWCEREVFAEDQGQPTSVDLYLTTDKKESVVVEFKFTEAEFGTCSVYEAGDCDGANPIGDLNGCYLHKNKSRSYMAKMKRYGLLEKTEQCPFTEFYQAFRLLMLAKERNGDFLLIYDERNPAFINPDHPKTKGKFRRFQRILPETMRDRAHVLSVQKILGYLDCSDEDCDWVQRFRERYGIPFVIGEDLPADVSIAEHQLARRRLVSGAVDRGRSHIELLYGDFGKDEDLESIALVAPGPGDDFTVQITYLPDVLTNEALDNVAAAMSQLEYFLVRLGERDPWLYARYYCSTAANMHSLVHWCYHERNHGTRTRDHAGRSAQAQGTNRRTIRRRNGKA